MRHTSGVPPVEQNSLAALSSLEQTARIYDFCAQPDHDFDVPRQLSDWQPRLINCRTVPLGNLEEAEPHVSLYRLKTGKSQLFVEHTVATNSPDSGQDTAYHFFSFPGMTEHIESGVRRQLQDAMAVGFPGAIKTSIGTNGIGRRLSWDMSSLDDMAAQRLELCGSLQRQERLLLIGTSLGSVLVNRLIQQNLDAGQPLPIHGQVLLSPALVPQKRVVLDMAVRFVPSLVQHTVQHGRRLASREQAQALGRLPNLLTHGIADFGTIGREVVDVLHGTPYDAVERAVAAHPTLVVTGARDPLSELPMWQQLQAKHPENVKLIVVPDRGHDLPFFADGGRLLAQAIRDSGIVA